MTELLSLKLLEKLGLGSDRKVSEYTAHRSLVGMGLRGRTLTGLCKGRSILV